MLTYVGSGVRGHDEVVGQVAFAVTPDMALDLIDVIRAAIDSPVEGEVKVWFNVCGVLEEEDENPALTHPEDPEEAALRRMTEPRSDPDGEEWLR